MSFLFRASILNNSDPYLACKYSVEEHPHYMDCSDCQNKAWCEKLALIEADRICKEGLAECQELLKHFEPKRKCKLP